MECAEVGFLNDHFRLRSRPFSDIDLQTFTSVISKSMQVSDLWLQSQDFSPLKLFVNSFDADNRKWPLNLKWLLLFYCVPSFYATGKRASKRWQLMPQRSRLPSKVTFLRGGIHDNETGASSGSGRRRVRHVKIGPPGSVRALTADTDSDIAQPMLHLDVEWFK